LHPGVDVLAAVEGSGRKNATYVENYSLEYLSTDEPYLILLLLPSAFWKNDKFCKPNILCSNRSEGRNIQPRLIIL